MTIAAEIIADSISPTGKRITSFQLTMPRFILPEYNTHRDFSRNSASSRAIPVRKQVAMIRNHPFVPIKWMYNQPGMQASEPMTPEDVLKAETAWLAQAEAACKTAEYFASLGPLSDKGEPLGLHKQWANRVLEPFMWHVVICTSTEWDNFWVQRNSDLAQPEIQALAQTMMLEFDRSIPRGLEYGEWHLPYIMQMDDIFTEEQKRKISASRCAKVSYLTQDNVPDAEADLARYDKLVSANPPHWSPLEHVATPWKKPKIKRWVKPLGNFRGWAQLRHNLNYDQKGTLR